MIECLFQLLEACTVKLGLNGAARRLFLEDGTEIYETNEVPRDGEIYVSNGESFKNPFTSIMSKRSAVNDPHCYPYL